MVMTTSILDLKRALRAQYAYPQDIDSQVMDQSCNGYCLMDAIEFEPDHPEEYQMDTGCEPMDFPVDHGCVRYGRMPHGCAQGS